MEIIKAFKNAIYVEYIQQGNAFYYNNQLFLMATCDYDLISKDVFWDYCLAVNLKTGKVCTIKRGTFVTPVSSSITVTEYDGKENKGE